MVLVNSALVPLLYHLLCCQEYHHTSDKSSCALQTTWKINRIIASGGRIGQRLKQQPCFSRYARLITGMLFYSAAEQHNETATSVQHNAQCKHTLWAFQPQLHPEHCYKWRWIGSSIEISSEMHRYNVFFLGWHHNVFKFQLKQCLYSTVIYLKCDAIQISMSVAFR